jgi:predicted ribosomally synthesized peptide with nif11-like leader
MEEAKVKEIFSDEAFVTSLLKIEAPEDVQKALKTKGLELSIDEIKTIGATLAKAAEKGGELNEAELEKVAGGMTATASGVVVAAMCGVAVAIGAVGWGKGILNTLGKRW